MTPLLKSIKEDKAVISAGGVEKGRMAQLSGEASHEKKNHFNLVFTTRERRGGATRQGVGLGTGQMPAEQKES